MARRGRDSTWRGPQFGAGVSAIRMLQRFDEAACEAMAIAEGPSDNEYDDEGNDVIH